jgi:hypothetical protein
MDLEVIRRVLSDRPFKPIVFHLENGEKQLIKHPEIIVTEAMIVAVDDDGLPVFIKPEAISAIRHPRRTARRRNGRTSSRR